MSIERRLFVFAAAAAIVGCGSGTTVGNIGAAPGAVATAAPGGSATRSPGPSSPPGASATPAAAGSATPTAAAAASATPTAAGASPQPQATGPALDVPAATLAASLNCGSSIANAATTPVLLVPGTDLIPSVNFSWNYERAFTADGIPWCAVTLPYSATGDIQTAGEYVVNAIRTMYASAGRKIDILGYSQGGMVPRWALRWWPDTRGMVLSYVGLDPSNHGTLDADAICVEPCLPADWQQASTSKFIAALNNPVETYAGIFYTVVFSYTDEVVVPNESVASSSSLSTGAGTIVNIAVQQICPTDVSEHLAMGSYDPVGYALAVDAFTHAGVASISRIPSSVCAELYQPGVDPSTFVQNYAAYLEQVGEAQIGPPVGAPYVSAEPTLAPYAAASP
jgi:hypothetical protein